MEAFTNIKSTVNCELIGEFQTNQFEIYSVFEGLPHPNNTAHVRATELKAINWLPTQNRVDQHTPVNITKFFKGMVQAYADEIFQPIDQSRVTRGPNFKVNLPFHNINACKNAFPAWGQNYGLAYLLIKALQILNL